ncbi:MAG: sensor histidine kinase [Ferrimicrobium sp.]
MKSLGQPSAWRGMIVVLAGMAAFSSTMVLIRDHLSVATAALVLVIPVVMGVVVGGFLVGVVGVVMGFLLYDFLFIPPYYTVSVGAVQNWVALVVYAVVVLLVARVVASLQSAQREAMERSRDFHRISEVTHLLIGDRPLPELLRSVTDSLLQAMRYESVLLLLAQDSELVEAASAGTPIPPEELQMVLPRGGRLMAVTADSMIPGLHLRVITLVTASRPVGMIVVRGGDGRPHERDLLATFANSAALAIEQAQLRAQAMRTEMLEERDRWRRSLIGAVSHDFRTPLASVKASVSTLRDPSLALVGSDRDELLSTIEDQTDRLEHLVSNLLDMTRVESGTLEAKRQRLVLAEVVNEAVEIVDREPKDVYIEVSISPAMPELCIDGLLIRQVVVNLLENAIKYSPPRSTVKVSALVDSREARVSISDSGPGVPHGMRVKIFEPFEKDRASAGAGLGLAIARAYVALHDGLIDVSDSPEGGAAFTVHLPCVNNSDDPCSSND